MLIFVRSHVSALFWYGLIRINNQASSLCLLLVRERK